jgi:hypothetical protein
LLKEFERRTIKFFSKTNHVNLKRKKNEQMQTISHLFGPGPWSTWAWVQNQDMQSRLRGRAARSSMSYDLFSVQGTLPGVMEFIWSHPLLCWTLCKGQGSIHHRSENSICYLIWFDNDSKLIPSMIRDSITVWASFKAPLLLAI